MRNLISWLQAARLPSLSYILIPLCLGQVMSYYVNGSFDTYIFLITLLYGICNQLYIIFGNDYADKESDKLNKTYTMFSGGSRVIIDGKIPDLHIKYACIFFAIFMIFISLFLSFHLRQPFIFILSISSILLLYFYSYPPIKLSYRGGGEILQMIGVGLVLPLFGYLVQAPNINSFQWGILPSLLLLNLTSAMSTSLPDEPSDRLTKKQTSTVLLGDSKVKKIIILIEFFAILLLHYWAVTTMDQKRIDPMILSLYLIPLLSLFGLKGKPGEMSLQIFVFFSILTTLSSQLLILYFYLYV